MRGPQMQPLRAMVWEDDGLTYVDQRFLPDELRFARATDDRSVIDAVVTSAVAGTRCVDIFCGFGVALARRRAGLSLEFDAAVERLRAAAASRGYACGALDRIAAMSEGGELSAARAILQQCHDIDRSIAEHALALMPAHGTLLTHGSTGALSTGGSGTAVGAILAAHRSGKQIHVYVGETRPCLTGRRLAAYELRAVDIVCTVFPDGAAAALMKAAPISIVLVGAEAIAANGDTIGEIGTFAIALAAAHHRIPFYVTAPRASIAQGNREVQRSAPSVAGLSFDRPIDTELADQAMDSVRYDVTPGHLITAIITEYGISRPPYDESLPNLATRPRFEAIARRV